MEASTNQKAQGSATLAKFARIGAWGYEKISLFTIHIRANIEKPERGIEVEGLLTQANIETVDEILKGKPPEPDFTEEAML